MKKEINIEINSNILWDIDTMSLSELADWANNTQSIHEGTHSNISLNYEDDCLILQGTRLETNDEEEKRIKEEGWYTKRVEQHERQLYETLKAKYEEEDK